MPPARCDDIAVAQTGEKPQTNQDHSSLAETTLLVAKGKQPAFKENTEDDAEPANRFFGKGIPLLIALGIASWIMIALVVRIFY